MFIVKHNCTGGGVHLIPRYNNLSCDPVNKASSVMNAAIVQTPQVLKIREFSLSLKQKRHLSNLFAPFGPLCRKLFDLFIKIQFT